MLLDNFQSIIVKIGSALLVDQETGKLREEWMASLVADIAALHQKGLDVIIVSSGAVALGRSVIQPPDNRPLTLSEKQAAAACGQPKLIATWQKFMAPHGVNAAQMLLTFHDTERRRSFLNARNTLTTLLECRVIPVINENDTTATAVLRYGDNDRLAARIAQMAGAKCLILLSDVDGLYTGNPNTDPKATHIPDVHTIDAKIEEMAAPTTGMFGSGGMRSKIQAAKIAAQAGCDTLIANGHVQNPLQHLIDTGRCTHFHSGGDELSARKQWIGGTIKPAGYVVVDAGAEKALKNGYSLLSAGITRVDGSFGKGDVIAINNKQGTLLGKGLSNYDADELFLLVGRQSSDIPALLGYNGPDAIIHRDHMVLEQIIANGS